MGPLKERLSGLPVWAEQFWYWLIENGLELLLAVAIGASLVVLMLVIRKFGSRLRRKTHHSVFARVAGRVIGQSQIWFMVALAAALVVKMAHPPLAVISFVQFVFTVAFALQGAFWLREMVIAWLEERAVGKGDAGSTNLASALGIINLLVSVAAFVLAAVLILDNIGVNVTALVAGLGIGGIAIGLAAQGIFADLFAALSILFDKPFQKGDSIAWDNSAGTVEAIGLKSTRIRSTTGESIILSNTNLLNKELRNLEHLGRRRVSFSLGLIYQTPPAMLEKVPAILRAVVAHYDKCVFVRSSFMSFSASSLDYELVFDVLTDSYNDFIDHRTRVAIAITQVFAEHEIEFAYPTQTMFTADPDGRMIMPYPMESAEGSSKA